ncbi:MAG: DinB family protein [Planctomycetes bacterium]|nr:DinB family protein [Planctomycetota bacterium]
MNLKRLIDSLERFAEILPAVVRGVTTEDARWKPADGAWSILEIVTHLADEEVEDFRTRVERTRGRRLPNPRRTDAARSGRALATDRSRSLGRRPPLQRRRSGRCAEALRLRAAPVRQLAPRHHKPGLVESA